MEHLDSGSGLLHKYHHLLIGIRSDERSGVYLTDEESFVLLLNMLGLFESADNLIESWQAQVVGVHLLHVFVRSKDNDHKQRVIDKAALSKHFNVLFKLRNNLFRLNLSDI